MYDVTMTLQLPNAAGQSNTCRLSTLLKLQGYDFKGFPSKKEASIAFNQFNKQLKATKGSVISHKITDDVLPDFNIGNVTFIYSGENSFVTAEAVKFEPMHGDKNELIGGTVNKGIVLKLGEKVQGTEYVIKGVTYANDRCILVIE